MASDSSASTTPMVLTPDSTGGGSPESATALKKSRRQTAFYPNMKSTNKPLKPFSRSATKRESVMALGSIEHLQHYFTKTGIAAKKNPLEKLQHGLVPAIGGLSHVHTHPSLGSLAEFNLPPSPAIPSPPRALFSPHVKSYETDPDTLVPGVIDDLITVSKAWRIDPYGSSLLEPGTSPNSFDVLDVLKTTTHAIRSIRNYLFSLPDESAGTIRAQFRPKTLTPSLPPKASSTPSLTTQPDPLVLIRKSALEVLTVLRDLEERCRLPLTDDAYDAQSDGGGSRGGSHSRVASPGSRSQELPVEEGNSLEIEPERVHEFDPDTSVSFSLVQVQGRYESVPVWEDEDDQDEVEEEEKKERWDERLVLGTGWLYRQDVTLDELGREKDVVSSYLDVVDEVLFGGKKGDIAGKEAERGWEREKRRRGSRTKRRVSAGDVGSGTSAVAALEGKRRVSTGMLATMKGMTLSEEPEEMEGIGEEEEEENSVDDEDLPDWARRRTFTEDELGRAHAMLVSFLPSHLLSVLAPSSSRTTFLESLSSGQLLCVAYNSCVRKSKKPWGYVNKDGIHDIVALEEAARQDGDGEKVKKGWTFRRTDNLRLWAGALKIRYMLPIQVPSQPFRQESGTNTPASSGTPLNSPGPKAQHFARSTEPPLIFDAKIVAKRDDGWEDMLEAILLRWVQKAVDERRNV